MRLLVLVVFLCLAICEVSAQLNPDKVACIVNQVRRRNGAAPIQISNTLQFVAQNHANDQRRRNVMTHSSANGASPGQRAQQAGFNFRNFGENVAFGQRSEEEVMRAWIRSPGHFRNIVNPAFREMGIGRSGNFWAQEFGTRLNGQSRDVRFPNCQGVNLAGF
jgi:uncharacterized protein YkwD